MESTSTGNNIPSDPSSSSGEGTGIETDPVEITLASWGDRFLAIPSLVG
jgi:hypothetical protein